MLFCIIPYQNHIYTGRVLEEIGSIMVPVALKNINMNTKEKKTYDSTLISLFSEVCQSTIYRLQFDCLCVCLSFCEGSIEQQWGQLLYSMGLLTRGRSDMRAFSFYLIFCHIQGEELDTSSSSESEDDSPNITDSNNLQKGPIVSTINPDYAMVFTAF